MASAERCFFCHKTSSSRLLLCGNCKTFKYCSKDCQRADWRQGHKTSCAPAKRATLASQQAMEQMDARCAAFDAAKPSRVVTRRELKDTKGVMNSWMLKNRPALFLALKLAHKLWAERCMHLEVDANTMAIKSIGLEIESTVKGTGNVRLQAALEQAAKAEGNDKFLLLWVETDLTSAFISIPETSARIHFSLDVFDALETNPVHFVLRGAVATMPELEAAPDIAGTKLARTLDFAMAKYAARLISLLAWVRLPASAAELVLDFLEERAASCLRSF